MSRLKVLVTATAILSVLALGACGSDTSDTSEASDPATTSAPTTSAPPTTAPTTPATTPTPSASTTSPTTTPPTGKLIDYETADEAGVVVVTAADTKNLTGAPADFKTFIAAELARNAAGEGDCTEPAQIYVGRIDTGGWARGGYRIPQCGGSGALWAKSKGAWKEVWSGQSLVECTTLDTYAIPSRIAGDQCLKGDDAVAYSR